MKGSDNFKLLMKSLTPIKNTYSKINKELDKTFKSMSLENLIQNLNSPHKIKNEFCLYRKFMKNKNKNKYEINFRNSNKYIKELSDKKKLLLLGIKNNYIRNVSFNSDFGFNFNKIEEKNKLINENENIEKNIFSKRLKKLKILKKIDSGATLLDYNPNYDFIKKKIYSVHIRPPPSFTNIRQNNEDNKENEKYNNNNKKNLSTDKNKSINIIKEYIFDKMKSRNLKFNALNKNKRENNQIIFNNKYLNNYSMILKESYSNNSNSSKNQFIDSNNTSRNNYKLNGGLVNLKNLFNKNQNNRNQKINSDYFTMDINKSTNIENISNISSIFQNKEKLYKSNSLRNITNKKLKLPKIKKLQKINSLKNKSEGNNEIKHSIYFNKMSGRKDVNIKGKNNNYISYSPNYEILRPHIHSSFFCNKKNDENYKKYKTGKIIRNYNSHNEYFVFEFKTKKPIKFNTNREMSKILEILKKKSSNIV